MNITIAPIKPKDREQLVQIIQRQKNFLKCEIDIAIEVIDATFHPKEDYRVLAAADPQQRMLGFVSYGPIPLTENRFDLYWIAVDPQQGRHGIGTMLLAEMEKRLSGNTPVHIYIDTSSTEGYLPARRFYEKHGYEIAAHLKDFYRNGDDKIVYRKVC
ncbi:MAG: GNAT family N-acetyltransferase [Desulfofustis sp.]|nr:GNAT family N-acetyltransferase [Desulfofustis sp.]